MFENVRFSGDHRLGRHPDNGRIEMLIDFRNIARSNDHITATAVDLVFQDQVYGLGAEGFVEIAVLRNDPFYFRQTLRRRTMISSPRRMMHEAIVPQ